MKKITLMMVLAMVLLTFAGCDDSSEKQTFVDEGEKTPVIQDVNDNTDARSDEAEDENADEKAEDKPDDNQTQEPAEKEENKAPEQSDEPEIVEFDIVSVDGQYDYNIYSTDETVTLKVITHNTDGESVDFQWYRCDDKGNRLTDHNYSHPLSMGDSLEVSGIAYDEMLIPRYYVVNALVKNTLKSQVFSVTLCPTGVEVDEPLLGETDEEFMLVSEDGNYEYTTYSPEEEVVLKVTPLDTSGILSKLWDEEQKMYLVDYCWTRCDENGTTLESSPTPVSWGQTCTVSIPREEMMIPRYYRANVVVGDISEYVIFKVTLAPMGVEVDETL